jgi:Fe-S-cluster containining protein
MYMGDYIIIDHMIRPFEYACESVSTGTSFNVKVDEDKREIFSNQAFSDLHPAACKFLRPKGNLLQCTIHRDSPAQCKFYRCVVMRILNKTGMVIGTVTGTLSLHTDDPGLRSIWEGVWKKVRESDVDAEARIQVFFEDHGYHVI